MSGNINQRNGYKPVAYLSRPYIGCYKVAPLLCPRVLFSLLRFTSAPRSFTILYKKQAPYLFMDMTEGKMNAIPEGITEGLLRNIFLYLYHSAAASVLDSREPDDLWI